MSYFFVTDARKAKGDAVQFRGHLMVDAVVDHDDDGGGSGGGGGGGGTPRIDVPKLAEIKWIYSDGTPEWAIAAAQAAGYETVHIRDLPPNYPFE